MLKLSAHTGSAKRLNEGCSTIHIPIDYNDVPVSEIAIQISVYQQSRIPYPTMYATGSPQTEVNLYRYPVKCAFPVKRSSQKVQLHRLRNTGFLCTGICVFFGLVFWCCFRCALVQGCITKDPHPPHNPHHHVFYQYSEYDI